MIITNIFKIINLEDQRTISTTNIQEAMLFHIYLSVKQVAK